MADKDELGRAGEDRAAAYLYELGWTLIERNWRCSAGEIDVVAEDGRDLVIVEVKTRRGEGFGHPFEAVDARKKGRLWRLAMAWIAAHPDRAQGRRLRLDAVSVLGPDPATGTLEHLRDLR